MSDQRLTPQEEQTVRECVRLGTYGVPHVEKLLAQIDRLRGERQWQPIETAPEDGCPFLVWLKAPSQHSHVHSAFFHPNVKVIGGHFAFDMPEATHWMPLPAAPDATVPPRPQEATQPLRCAECGAHGPATTVCDTTIAWFCSTKCHDTFVHDATHPEN